MDLLRDHMILGLPMYQSHISSAQTSNSKPILPPQQAHVELKNPTEPISSKIKRVSKVGGLEFLNPYEDHKGGG